MKYHTESIPSLILKLIIISYHLLLQFHEIFTNTYRCWNGKKKAWASTIWELACGITNSPAVPIHRKAVMYSIWHRRFLSLRASFVDIKQTNAWFYPFSASSVFFFFFTRPSLLLRAKVQTCNDYARKTSALQAASISLIYLETTARCQQNFRILVVKNRSRRWSWEQEHNASRCLILASLHHAVHQIYPRPDWC